MGTAVTGHSSTPLFRKLGIKEGSTYAVVNEPDDVDFAALLEDVPAGARAYQRASRPLDVIVFFAESRQHLRRRFGVLAGFLETDGGLWVAYAKRSSPKAGDLTFEAVQSIGLEEGLVDNKSCSIDDDWTAVRFVKRLADRP